MAIPDYQTLMLPLLMRAGDGQEHRIGDATQKLANEFHLGEEELQHLLPSGMQTTFANRVAWAKTYMTQAGLLEGTRRAHFRITDRGLSVLNENPKRIDTEYLARFPEFVSFRSRSRPTENNSTAPTTVEQPALIQTQTPDELLRSTVKQMDAALSQEILDRILSAPPVFFEGLIVQLLLAMGYVGSRQEAGQIVGKSGDGGNRWRHRSRFIRSRSHLHAGEALFAGECGQRT